MKIIIFLIVILLCFCMAGMAKAETAWVEWMHEFQPKLLINTWQLQQAFPNHESCMQAMHTDTKNLCSNFTSSTCSVYGDLVVIKDGESVHSVFFACYPDTIDPRKK